MTLPHDDPAFVGRIRALLHDVERAAGRPGLARLLQFALEPEVFSPQCLTDRLAVNDTLLVRQDLARLTPIAVDAGIDRVCVEFRSGPRIVGPSERHERNARSKGHGRWQRGIKDKRARRIC